ncbi:SseB family protein [Actinomadura madurae]|uniref:SseB family protein n=1 Tax=Actinomadura madurae TaxID=1993 RepID=UPI0020D1F94C|nr:SseB family protein [Actinomadura madurae]MCP9966674.1 SseB family protein [Actinomadura madurae]
MADRFEPQNDIEQRLLDAARRRDTDGFFKILLGAQVLVPADTDTPWGIVPGDAEFPWRPVPVHGRTSIQLFTSLKWMNEALGTSRFIMPSLLEMVTAWPDTNWTLVLNPGTPIDASMPGDQVRTLRGPATPPSASTPPPPEAPAVPVAPAVPSTDPAPPGARGSRPHRARPGHWTSARGTGRHRPPLRPVQRPPRPGRGTDARSTPGPPRRPPKPRARQRADARRSPSPASRAGAAQARPTSHSRPRLADKQTPPGNLPPHRTHPQRRSPANPSRPAQPHPPDG